MTSDAPLPSGTPQPLPQPPPELVEALQKRECVLFSGAGIGAQSGLPIWRPFVEGLLDWAIEQRLFDPQHGQILRQTLVEKGPDLVADSVVSAAASRPSELHEYLRQVFLPPWASPNPIHRALAPLPFAAALTTNFDAILDTVFASRLEGRTFTPDDTEPLRAALAQQKFFLLKLYGSIERPPTLVLAPFEFEDAVARNLPFSQFLENLFLSRTLLFLGASLEGIQNYLAGVRFKSTPVRRHFALVDVAGESWRVSADQLSRRYGIEVLPFTASAGFPELPRFVERLGRASQPADGSFAILAGDEPAVSAPSGLGRVRLENLGPFESVELELNPGWTILLGDNGVGKSTILKAIALALAGEAARPFAGRLLRAGATKGSVTLQSGRASYVVEVFRNEPEARVTTTTGNPLEAEGWLAVGFPPLRMVSWERPGLVADGLARPSAADVLPLLDGRPDPRLDRLKSWIVDVYLRDKEQQTRSDGSDRYRRLLDDIFHVLERLTPGLSLRLKDVNSATKEVTVETDDGPIPLEAVSQGTASLLGWVGVLLERLYEIYGDDPTLPVRRRYALVLVDEIDAHMHPGWQQTIVPALTELFPHVQFVATSHSPLLIGDLAPEAILVLERDPATRRIALGHPPVDPRTLRADQILTSSFFGLRSTRGHGIDRAIARYAELKGKPQRTPAEEGELTELKRHLDEGLLAGETPAQRQAEKLIHEVLAGERPAAATPPAALPLAPEVELELKRQLGELLGRPAEAR